MQVEIQVMEVTGVATKTKVDKDEGLVTTLQVECKVAPQTLARIHNLIKQNQPMYLTLGSKQAHMDLEAMEPVEDLSTLPLIPGMESPEEVEARLARG